MKFKFIADHREMFKVSYMCAIIHILPSGFYSWLAQPEILRALENRALADMIRSFHAAIYSTCVSPKIHRDLTDQGIRCSHNRIAWFVQEYVIFSLTASLGFHYFLKKAPNLELVMTVFYNLTFFN